MKKSLFLISLFSLALLFGCSAGFNKPFYKPSNLLSSDSKDLWKQGKLYSTAGVELYDKNVKVFVGNNGVIEEKNEVSGLSIGIGLYVEIENYLNEDVSLLSEKITAVDKNGKLWKVVALHSKDNLKEVETQTLGVNIKTYTANAETGSLRVSANDYERVVQDVIVKSNNIKFVNLILTSDYTKENQLPKEIKLDIKFKKGNELVNCTLPFNAIEW